MYKKYGYVRIGAVVPKMKVANVDYNVRELIGEILNAHENGVQILNTPELSICGYTCGDLFSQELLLKKCIEGLGQILEETQNLDIITILGMPLACENQLLNVAVVIQYGKILGIVPKTYIPNYAEFYEKRWFVSSTKINTKTISLLGQTVPLDTNMIFQDKENSTFNFAIEICEDLWGLYSPSNRHAFHGANLIFNLSASNAVIGKSLHRKELVQTQSSKIIAGYCYVSAGANESTTDTVFSGHTIIAENGKILAEEKQLSLESNLITADMDFQKIAHARYMNTSYKDIIDTDLYTFVDVEIKDNLQNIKRKEKAYPFVPQEKEKREERCKEIFAIQAFSLAKRLLHTKIQKTVIGMSGGLDSTLAFLVIVEAYKKLGIPNENILAITMPGFGTTDRTYHNACNLVKCYGATLREISIKEACIQHFKDISVSEEERNTTFENAQARERTQILMDIANEENALVIGTADLSETALGWCTYNGDHMSMYAVNCGVPKTLVKYLVNWVADISDEKEKQILLDILDTPISPELLPPDEKGQIEQKTEDNVGPYILHDFFLYHFMRTGATPEKIFIMAQKTFEGMYTKEEILKWLKRFITRFFFHQFKKNCIPDGPKVGTISLSPRADWKMPSDADVSIWLAALDKILL